MFYQMENESRIMQLKLVIENCSYGELVADSNLKNSFSQIPVPKYFI